MNTLADECCSCGHVLAEHYGHAPSPCGECSCDSFLDYQTAVRNSGKKQPQVNDRCECGHSFANHYSNICDYWVNAPPRCLCNCELFKSSVNSDTDLVLLHELAMGDL